MARGIAERDLRATLSVLRSTEDAEGGQLIDAQPGVAEAPANVSRKGWR